MYEITDYSYKKAKELGVKIKPSTHKGKKIDVFDYNNNFITAIGAIANKDYPHYLLQKGKKYADERRRLYKLRHDKDRKVLGSAGYYASKILW
jgi:hypothetical protein